jgi:hypothetical protein
MSDEYVDLNRPLTVAWAVLKWQLLAALLGRLLLA